LIRYRPFRNCDPPAIAEIWRSHPPLRRLAPYVSAAQFEQLVLAKPYFDGQGLIVAEENDRPIGFAHAAFGARQDGADLDREVGVVCRLMIAPHDDGARVAGELLARSEAYLLARGAKTLLGGGVAPADPFYLGLYGGSELPGVLASDTQMQELLRGAGYMATGRRLVLELDLAGFRPAVSRQQMQVRRASKVESALDPPPATWWEACTLGSTDRTRFSLQPKNGGGECGAVTFWNMQPLAASWGVHAAGMVQLAVAPAARRQGLATFLLGEALRQLHAQGITLIEAQATEDDAPTLRLLRKLGFRQVDEGVRLQKTVT
jgi:GNAT superfamily N-acetyltransferase